MPFLGDALSKMARGEQLSPSEAEQLRLLGNNIQRAEGLVRSWSQIGESNLSPERMRANIVEADVARQLEGRYVALTTNPPYVDGEVIVYFYSDGAGDDQLKARGKVGATETEVSLGNITP